MKKKSLLFTLAILGVSCALGGFVGQTINSNPFAPEKKIGVQKTKLNTLPDAEPSLQVNFLKQILSNQTQIHRVQQQLTQVKKTINQLMLAQENEGGNISQVQQQLAQLKKTLDLLALTQENEEAIAFQPYTIEEENISDVTTEESIEDRQFVDHFANYLESEVNSLDDDQESIFQIEQSFEAELENKQITGVSLLNSECKETLCKIELGFDDETTREKYSHLGTSVIPWGGQAFFHQSESESNIMIYYVAREGFDLALPESFEG